MSLNTKEMFEFCNFRVDVRERLVERIDGLPVRGRLPDKTFDVLVVLLQRYGHLVSRDELLEQVWPNTFVEENSVDKRIHAIRHFLGEEGNGDKYIETVRGRGFRFVANVRSMDVSGSWLPGSLRPSEKQRPSRSFSINPEAVDQYWRGKYYLHHLNVENNAKAITALEAAVAADPEFAAAHAELSQAYMCKLFFFDPEQTDLAEKAYISVEKALSLDPYLAVGYLARGRLLWTPANRFPHDAAICEYRRALELDPDLDEARHQLALIYGHIGATDEALAELRHAIAANPNNSVARFRIGETLLFQGKYEEALTALRESPKDANPAIAGHQIVWALLQLGRTEEAEVALHRFLKENPADNRGLITSQLAVLSASVGRYDEAESYIAQAIRNGKGFGHFHHTAFHIACAYSVMNRPDEAMNWLEAAAEDGFPCYSMFENDRYLANVHETLRFKAFIEKLRHRWGVHRNAADNAAEMAVDSISPVITNGQR
jgi:DNA-binding winged helix-turn-helix (wHTH) protein/thioredoxin-like negative regulator of GroEL